MANQPIPVTQANEMIAAYLAYMSELGADMTQQTHSISFTAPELLKWMTGVQPYTDEFRICEAVYTAGHPNAGRITTIIWPYKDNKPAVWPRTEGELGDPGSIPPYNEGNGRP